MDVVQTPPVAAPMRPSQPAERIPLLDIVRGFAVFGILVVDIPAFASPIGLPGYVPSPPTSWYDALCIGLVHTLANGKFYTIFSFLFGLGFSLQHSRFEAHRTDMRSFYFRRLWVLLGIGILHSVFLWTADILRIYALLGFALPALYKRSDRTLLILAGLFCLPGFFMAGLARATGAGGNAGPPGIDVVGMARAAYNSSSYVDVVIFQALSSPFAAIITLLTRGPNVMALLLIGVLVGRSRFLARLPEKRVELQRVFRIGLLAGFAANGLMLLSRNPWLNSLGNSIGSLSLSAAYVSGLALLWLTPVGARTLGPLGKVGRMALSNYIGQSLVCTLLFDGFIFGLYEKVDPAGLQGIAILICFAQILFSSWWLSRFQFGPVEWLWRSLTYRRRQPFRCAPLTL